MNLYFFRDISNYDELRKKTINARSRNSVHQKKAVIVKTIELEDLEACFFEKIRSDNHYIIENLELMKVKNGIWYCIEMVLNEKTIVVMANGYPYAKFTALKP